MREPFRRSHFDTTSVPNRVRAIVVRRSEAPDPGQGAAAVDEFDYDAIHAISAPEQTLVVAQTFAKSGHYQQARTPPRSQFNTVLVPERGA